jgi:hypothetical protein
MKHSPVFTKKFISLLLLIYLLPFMGFILGPSLGFSIMKKLTPPETIQTWKDEASCLDNMKPRTAESEARRMQLLLLLGQRGIDYDGGPDEELENAPFVTRLLSTSRQSWLRLFGQEAPSF